MKSRCYLIVDVIVLYAPQIAKAEPVLRYNEAFVDTGDLPYFIALINVPIGSFKLGSGTAAVGIPTRYYSSINHSAFIPMDDLTYDWYRAFGQPVNHGRWGTPEPSSLSQGALSAAGLVAIRRRRL